MAFENLKNRLREAVNKSRDAALPINDFLRLINDVAWYAQASVTPDFSLERCLHTFNRTPRALPTYESLENNSLFTQAEYVVLVMEALHEERLQRGSWEEFCRVFDEFEAEATIITDKQTAIFYLDLAAQGFALISHHTRFAEVAIFDILLQRGLKHLQRDNEHLQQIQNKARGVRERLNQQLDFTHQVKRSALLSLVRFYGLQQQKAQGYVPEVGERTRTEISLTPVQEGALEVAIRDYALDVTAAKVPEFVLLDVI